MGRKQELENQIADNMKIITNYNNTKDTLNKRIVEFDDKLLEIEKHKRNCFWGISGSITALIASFTLAIFFPSSILPYIGMVASFVGASISTILYPNKANDKAEYAFLVKENDKLKNEYVTLNNEQFKVLEQTNHLKDELGKILSEDNKIKQNLQQAKVLHSKEFKQFKNYLNYKNNKTEQSTEQTTSNELEIKM